jgi:hypothetical protein
MRVYILLYNTGTDNEGIHTLQVGDRNIVLMFESEDDATRYGLMLEAQDFPSPSLEVIESEEVEEFCRDAGYDWKIIEEGLLAVPPEQNLEQMDWNSQGHYRQQTRQETSESSDQMSPDELERIRRRLEGLL